MSISTAYIHIKTEFSDRFADCKLEASRITHKVRKLNLDAKLSIAGSAGRILHLASFISILVKSSIGKTLFYFSLPFQLSNVTFSVKKANDCYEFKKLFTKEANLTKSTEDYTVEDFKSGYSLIASKCYAEKLFIARYFNTTIAKLNKCMKAIETEAQNKINSGNVQKILEGKEQLKSTMDMLAKRMSEKITKDSVEAVTGTVDMIGLGLLLSPAAIIGFALLTVSYTTAFATAIADIVLTEQFLKKLG